MTGLARGDSPSYAGTPRGIAITPAASGRYPNAGSFVAGKPSRARADASQVNGLGPVISAPMESIEPSLPVSAVLDVKGLKCPLPLLKTKVALNRLQPGQILRVLATDPMAAVDLRAFCARSGHEMLSWAERRQVWEFFIRKVASD